MNEKKIMLVTGASSEIGCELIKKVAENYEVIIAHYYNCKKDLEEIQLNIGKKLILMQADFSDAESVKSMIENIKNTGYFPNHIVHLSAQKLKLEKFIKCDWNIFRQGIETSVHSIVDILQAFIPNMVKNKDGKIIFMLTSSTLGIPPKYQAAYVSVKYMLLGLMKSLSAEYADKGITINGISPDMIETKFLTNIPDMVVQKNAQNSPIKRNLTLNDVIPAFEYLLSDAANAVTGQNLGITGGIC